MDILVRNIDSNIVSKIDKLAKEKRLSRNDFLSNQIEEIAYENEINTLEKNYQILINNLIDVMKNHTTVLGSFMDEFIIDGEDAYNLDVYNNLKNIAIHIPTSSTDEILDSENISIRNIPREVLDRIDEIAKGRNISRNDFLNIYLKQLIYSSKLKLTDEKYNYAIEKALGILDFSNRILHLFKEENCI